MNVLIDFQTFYFQKYGGISLYFSELIKQYDNRLDLRVDLPIEYSSNENLKYISRFKNVKTIPDASNTLSNYYFPFKRTIFNYLLRINFIEDAYMANKSITLEHLKRIDIQLFHPTYYDNYFLDTLKIKNIPYVITVYDLIHELFPYYFDKNDIVYRNREMLLQNSANIIAISNSTKNDIIKYYNINPEKITTIYLSSSIINTSNYFLYNKIYENYILYVGDRNGYKNFDKLLNAFYYLRYDKPNLILVAYGSSPFNKKECVRIKELNLDNRVIHVPFKSKTEQHHFYKNALLFIFPSLYEGFGIPILEAFESGCPVACSNSSSLKEISEDAAELFDPNDAYSIYKAILKILSNKYNSNDLTQKGKKVREKYSWEITSKKTLELYKKSIKC